MSNFLHYYQCKQCLSIGTNEALIQKKALPWFEASKKPQKVVYIANAKCNACAGDIWYLGQVREDQKRLEGKIEKTACDKRCTHASGPVCVCQCGCKNHGKGSVIEILMDLGPVPELKPVDPIKAKANADQIHKLIAAYADVIAGAIPDLKKAYENAKKDYSAPRLPHSIYKQAYSYFMLSGGHPVAVANLKYEIWNKVTNHDHRVKHIVKLIDEARAINETIRLDPKYNPQAVLKPAETIIETWKDDKTGGIIPASELVKDLSEKPGYLTIEETNKIKADQDQLAKVNEVPENQVKYCEGCKKYKHDTDANGIYCIDCKKDQEIKAANKQIIADSITKNHGEDNPYKTSGDKPKTEFHPINQEPAWLVEAKTRDIKGLNEMITQDVERLKVMYQLADTGNPVDPCYTDEILDRITQVKQIRDAKVSQLTP